MLISHSKSHIKESLPKVDPDHLWSEIREGNRKALSKLFCLYYAHLFNYGFRIVPNRVRVEDSIQELFLNLWNRRNRISQAYSVKSYLFHSLRRLILRKKNKEKNRTQRNKVYIKNYLQEACNIEQLMIQFEIEQERKTQLMKGLQSLSKRQKEAILLKYYDGLSNTEIATVMNINQQSVYNHISTAIGNLQEVVRV